MISRLAPLTLYVLKRQFAAAISIYKLTGSTTNARTGERVQIITVYAVKRAVALPAGYTRLKAPGETGASGSRGSNARDFLVDRKDVPNLSLSANDWIVCEGKKYQVSQMEVIDAAWLISTKELVGEIPKQKISKRADNMLNLTGEATNE